MHTIASDVKILKQEVVTYVSPVDVLQPWSRFSSKNFPWSLCG